MSSVCKSDMSGLELCTDTNDWVGVYKLRIEKGERQRQEKEMVKDSEREKE